MLFGTPEPHETTYEINHSVMQARRKSKPAGKHYGAKGLDRPRPFKGSALIAIEAAKRAGIEADWNGAQTYTKKREAAEARFVVWYVLRQSGIGPTHAGRLTGGHDHTTVLNGLRKVKERFSETALNTACLFANLPAKSTHGRVL